jgi:hypothetical protein
MIPRIGLYLVLAGCMVRGAGAQSTPSTPVPSPATGGPGAEHAVGYYDPGLRRVVLVGGAAAAKPGQRDRVWSWSGKRWELLSDAGPPSRVNAAAAYDARRRKAVVSGGSRRSQEGSSWEVAGDTWEGDRGSWRPVGDIAPRDHHAMVTDGRGSILMFGGIPAARSGPWPADTWEFRSGAWARVASDGPSGRARTALAYDRKRGQVVLFGGVSAQPAPDQPQTFLQDTWTWEGGAWRKAAADGPPGRYAHGMVFDEKARVVLLYGGSAAHRGAPLADMWQWDGRRWTEIRLTGPTPGHRYQPVMVYDKARGRTVLYGGLSGFRDDTWEWDGRRWEEIKP